MICAVQEERCCGKCANKMTSSYMTTRSNQELEYFIFPFTWFEFTSCIMCYEVQDVCVLMTDCVYFVHLIKTEKLGSSPETFLDAHIRNFFMKESKNELMSNCHRKMYQCSLTEATTETWPITGSIRCSKNLSNTWKHTRCQSWLCGWQSWNQMQDLETEEIN